MAGAEAVEQPKESGLLIALVRQVVRPGLQGVEVDVAGALDHELEAASVAEAPDRRRPENQHAGLGHLAPKAFAEPGGDGLAGQPRVPPLGERLEDDEHGAVVRAVGVQNERRSRDGHRVRHAGRFQRDLLDCVGHLDRAFQ